MIEEVMVKTYAENEVFARKDAVIKEHRANIFVNGEHYISLMCLPQCLDELAVGFLFSEGLIRSYGDIAAIDAGGADHIYITLSKKAADTKTAHRAVLSGFTQGSVNLAFFEHEKLPLINSRLKLSSAEVVKMADSFSRRSELFRLTGAVHSCALILPDSTDLFYEDIGRHNALDKAIGKALMAGLSMQDAILLTSGRVSSEILIKTAGLGIPVLLSLSAPTSMAVKIAQKINMTLIGFARGNRFNVYAGDGRIVKGAG